MDNKLEDNAILVFHDKWCAQCYTEKRVLNEFIKNNPDKNLVINVDAEERPDLFEKYQVKHTPTMIFIKDGKVVEEFRKYLDLEQFSQAVRYYY
ncbi:thioredoxin 1 [Lactobacillus colini]|uniref:Thioredoxin 1 n=1 Tax=Lactobacillus colini TaxID=1819254 RepID=A0ABS4MG96_9LACO|nr:thioredoxin family protein [Lactobacillus colini]MBP2058717.1 thioredoxin 1 [Lactobacillus colini]